LATAKVTAFCDAAAQLLSQIGAYAATDVAQRQASDAALVRQLRVAAAALNVALDTLARMTPTPMRRLHSSGA
jgi:hypothetical protein